MSTKFQKVKDVMPMLCFQSIVICDGVTGGRIASWYNKTWLVPSQGGNWAVADADTSGRLNNRRVTVICNDTGLEDAIIVYALEK